MPAKPATKPAKHSAAATYCAAVDLGATSGRVILGAWTRDRLALREVHRFPNAIRTLNGHDYWEIGALWHEVQTGLRRAAAALPRSARLASVGVDTWGVDYALLNDAGRLVFPIHAYRDNRTQPALARLARTPAALERIYAATGIANVFYNTSLQLSETIAACPAITDLATRCLLLPDYLNYLLSGVMANELSIASTTQLLDVHTTTWCDPPSTTSASPPHGSPNPSPPAPASATSAPSPNSPPPKSSPSPATTPPAPTTPCPPPPIPPTSS